MPALSQSLLSQWHPTKNAVDVDTITAGSGIKFWWLGPCGHEWMASPLGRKKGQGCPYCAGRKILVGFNDLGSRFPQIASEWHPSLNGNLSPEEVTGSSSKSVWWLGSCGHSWKNGISNRTGVQKQGCPFCSRKKVLAGFNDLATTNPALASEWHPTLNGELLPAQILEGSSKSVWWQCKQGHVWEMVVARRKMGEGCKVCSGHLVEVGVDDLVTTHPHLASEWHPTQNGTLVASEVKASSSKKVWWKATCGHEWQATPAVRVRAGYGCTYCEGRGLLLGFNDLSATHPQLASEWHPTLNGNLAPEEVKATYPKKIWWKGACKHEWEDTLPHRASERRGCPYCSGARVLSGFNDLATTHPELASEWHPSLNGALTPQQVSRGYKEVWWRCEAGHEWEAAVYSRIRGIGCPACRNYLIVAGDNDLASVAPDISSQWHPTLNGALAPSQVGAGSSIPVWWQCEKGHSWKTAVLKRTQEVSTGCPTCNAQTFSSKGEKEILAFLEGMEPTEVQHVDRKTLRGQELDIFIPAKRLAVEFNGIYWHSEVMGKDKTYHQRKWQLSKSAGIQLVQIWEDEWRRNPEQVKRMLAHKLNLPYGDEKKVMARKTEVSALTKDEAETFFDSHHIQGYASASYYLALKEKDTQEVVAALALKKEAGTEGRTLNIVRYATSAVVAGGFTKLLKHAERVYQPERFITFSDNCVSDGGLYRNNGFVADKELAPDYMYVVKAERKHKFGYRLKRFRNDPDLRWEEGLTELELASLNGLQRIWDAGKTRWVHEVKKPANI